MSPHPALAIILARGGSKGLPRKNVLPVAGKPCIAWTIQAARAAAGVGLVVVSSDDPEIVRVSEACSAVAHRRSADLASDTARVDDAARETLASIEQSSSLRANSPWLADQAAPAVILYANVPVRPAGCIDRALDTLRRTGADSVQSYQPVGKHHPWWTARVDPDSGAVSPWEGDVLNHAVFRRQDLPPAFLPDGAVIALTRRALRLEVPGVAPGPHAFFGRDRRGIVNPEGSVVDIDTPLDLRVADAMLSVPRAPVRSA